ncbi:MAG TPA: hypothetical protein PLE19_22825 [Planctomycetota bacterium]|nr:hypothetical protein [Planctomycetota bacterium]HRR82863.1 hypothetical protein [Planctomycetota bacterium]HRT96412.1 hypothetical protein [Planctomycetota bacterium]
MRWLAANTIVVLMLALAIPCEAAGRGGPRPDAPKQQGTISGKFTGYLLADAGPCWVFRYKKLDKALTTIVNPNGSVSAYVPTWVVSLSLDAQQAERWLKVGAASPLIHPKLATPPMLKEVTSAREAVAEMARRPSEGPSWTGLWLNVPVVVDPDLQALKALRARHAWQGGNIDEWLKIERPEQLWFRDPLKAQEHLDADMRVLKEIELLPETQMSRNGVVLSKDFVVATETPEALPLGQSGHLGLRFFVRRIVDGDLYVPDALNRDQLLRPGMRGGSGLSNRNRLRVDGAGGFGSKDLSLGDKDPLGDGKWHAVEILHHQGVFKRWIDGVLEEKKELFRPQRLHFSASPDPVLLADIQTTLKAASGKEAPEYDPGPAGGRHIRR